MTNTPKLHTKSAWLLGVLVLVHLAGATDTITMACDKIVALNKESLKNYIVTCSYNSPRSAEMKIILDSKFKSADTCSILLYGILEAGLYCNGVDHYSHFIQDSLLTKILISFLRSDDLRIRDESADFLTTYANPRHLQYYSTVIQQYCGIDSILAKPVTSIAIIKLLCLTDLNSIGKKRLLGKKYLPQEVRARLGDTVALNRVIKEYKDAPNVIAKWQQSKFLGYIANDRTARTLAEGLEKQQLLADGNNEISIRYYIIQALSRIHPENPLFTFELEKEKTAQTKTRGLPINSNNTYVGNVKKWAQETYQIIIKTDTTDAILYKTNYKIR